MATTPSYRKGVTGSVTDEIVSKQWFSLNGDGGISLKDAKDMIGTSADVAPFGFSGEKLHKDGSSERIDIYRLNVDGQVKYACNGRVSIPKGKLLQLNNISHRILGEVMIQHIFRDTAVVGSRVSLLKDWINHKSGGSESLRKIMTQPVRPDKQEQESWRPLYLKLLGTSLMLDALLHTSTEKEMERNAGEFQKGMLDWQERGYNAGDGSFSKEINGISASLSNLFFDGAVKAAVAPKFDSNKMGMFEINEEVAHESFEIESTEYKDNLEFYKAYLVLNFDAIRRGMYSVRIEQSMPTTYPGVKIALGDALPARFKKKEGVSLEFNKAFTLNFGDGPEKVYSFTAYEGDKKFKTRCLLNEDEFKEFRRVSYPELKYGSDKARYLGSDSSYVGGKREWNYNYLITSGLDKGKTHSLDAESHRVVIRDNPELISRNVRKVITNVDKFFEFMPNSLAMSLPDEEGRVALKSYIDARLNKVLIPAMVKVANPNKSLEEIQSITKEFMKELMIPLKSVGAFYVKDGKLDMAALEEAKRAEKVLDSLPKYKATLSKLEDKRKEHIEATVDKFIFTKYVEAQVGISGNGNSYLNNVNPPDAAYRTYKENNKYEYWVRAIARGNGIDTNDESQVGISAKLLLDVTKDANAWVEAYGFANLVPESQKAGLAKNFTKEAYLDKVANKPTKEIFALCKLLAECVTGTTLDDCKPEELLTIVDAESVVLLHNVVMNRFLSNYTLDPLAREGKLPYILPEFKLEYSSRQKDLQERATKFKFITHEEWESVEAATKKKVKLAVPADKLNDKERNLLTAILVAHEGRKKDAELERLGALVGCLYDITGKKLKDKELCEVFMETRPSVITSIKKMVDRGMAENILEAYELAIQGPGKTQKAAKVR